MNMILGLSMIIFFVLFSLNTNVKFPFVFTKPITIWLVFGFYSLLSGVFVAFNTVHLANSIFTYFQILAMLIYIVNISIIEKDNSFFLKSYLMFSLIYMFTMLFFGYNGPGNRLYLSEISNPNGDGIILIYGVFCLLMLIDTKKLKRFMLSLILLVFYSYTIIQTGSRKSFIVLGLFVILWFVLVYKDFWKTYSMKNKMISVIIFSLFLFIIIYNFLPVLLESTLYYRLSEGGYTISSSEARSNMYIQALDLFYKNVLFGVGFDQYRIVYGGYSHSTYAEIISTTGIIGTVLYFSSYLIIIYNLIKLSINHYRPIVSIKSKQYLILMVAILALGLGIIHFYNINDNIMFGLMISFYEVQKRKIKSNKKGMGK
jgi:O-antigen ligase